MLRKLVDAVVFYLDDLGRKAKAEAEYWHVQAEAVKHNTPSMWPAKEKKS